MYWFGKLIGGILGWWVAGPFGVLLGVFVGHAFDTGLKKSIKHNPFAHHAIDAAAQQVFFAVTFQVMGYVAKSDGRVSEREIRAAEQIMQQMQLNDSLKQMAIRFFNEGKQPEFDLKASLARLGSACSQYKTLLRMFVEIQIQAAQADGKLDAATQHVLQQICQYFGFSLTDFLFYDNIFRQYSSYQQQERQHQYHRPNQQRQHLQDAYAILGISESATDAEVKRAYRKQMSQHHPDKLVSKGLPEEMMKLATEKAQNIKSAYDQIKKAREL